MGRAFVKNTTFNLQVGQQKKKQSKLFVVPVGLSIFFFSKVMGVCQKRPICVQSEVILVPNVCPLLGKEKTATLNPKRFSNKISDTAMPLRTMFRGLWHHQRSEWVEPLLKTQPLIYK